MYGAGKSKGVVDDYDFSFEGMFGTYDRDQLRRGCKCLLGLRRLPWAIKSCL